MEDEEKLSWFEPPEYMSMDTASWMEQQLKNHEDCGTWPQRSKHPTWVQEKLNAPAHHWTI